VPPCGLEAQEAPDEPEETVAKLDNIRSAALWPHFGQLTSLVLLEILQSCSNLLPHFKHLNSYIGTSSTAFILNKIIIVY
jgi:hypothetical protein